MSSRKLDKKQKKSVPETITGEEGGASFKPSGVVCRALPKTYLVGGTLVPKIFSQREVNEKRMRKPQDHFLLPLKRSVS